MRSPDHREFPTFCATWIRRVRADPNLEPTTKLTAFIIAASSGVQWSHDAGTGTLRSKSISELLEIERADVADHARALRDAGHLRLLGVGDRGEERLRMIRSEDSNNYSATGADMRNSGTRR